MLATAAVYWPGAQAAQASSPGEPWNVPVAQLVQLPDISVEYVPAPHIRQAAAPSIEYEPAEQLEQVLAPASE